MLARLITRSDLAEALLSREPPIVLEALPRDEFYAGHIPTAKAMPLDEVNIFITRLPSDRGTTIIVYGNDMSCPNSRDAAEELERLGYRNVFVYGGGKSEWRSGGLRLEL